jgi:hypothetical protein
MFLPPEWEKVGMETPQEQGRLYANPIRSEVTRGCHALSRNLPWLHRTHARIMLGTHCEV